MKTLSRMNRLGWTCSLLGGAALLLGAADGSWLRRVPVGDRAEANPLAGQAAAEAAGSRLYANHCATCHGVEGLGKPGRPPVVSDRVEHATDGELAWLLKNGNPWKGMPAWSALPTAERRQLVAYLRRLNTAVAPAAGAAKPPAAGAAEPKERPQ